MPAVQDLITYLRLVDLGDVPTWLATIGAAVAAAFAYRAYQLETRRDTATRYLLKQEQASLVAVWAERRDHPHTNMPDEVEVFRLRNASPLPVYNVQVFSHRYVDRDTPIDDAIEDSRFDIGTLPPAEAPRVEIAHVSSTDSFVYSLEFRDASGNQWHRDRRGQLNEGPLVGRAKFQSRHPMTFDDF